MTQAPPAMEVGVVQSSSYRSWLSSGYLRKERGRSVSLKMLRKRK